MDPLKKKYIVGRVQKINNLVRLRNVGIERLGNDGLTLIKWMLIMMNTIWGKGEYDTEINNTKLTQFISTLNVVPFNKIINSSTIQLSMPIQY